MPDLPPTALEMTFDETLGTMVFRPVEAPPCGERLDLDDHGVHLTCDLVRGHQDATNKPETKHRMVLPGTNHPTFWCDDDCAHQCLGPLSALAIIRRQGKT